MKNSDELLEPNERVKESTEDKENLLLAQFALAGVEVLKERFGFSGQQATIWLDETLKKCRSR